ncbi:MFS transporter permease [Microbacterium sp. NPDC091313]
MWVRRAFYRWLLPSAFLLPVWLVVGWIAFDAGGWALLWLLFLALPSVFFGQLVLTLLVRARGTVRAERAVSWADVGGFAVWHLAVIGTGFFAPGWFVPVLVLAVAAAIGLFWLSLWQLWTESRAGARVYLRAADGTGFIPPTRPAAEPRDPEVFVITEQPPRV